jgi:acyl carrier protein
VVAQAEPTGSQRLVAYLVVEPGADTGAATLRAFLKTRLPEYMIPAIFVTLDRLPLTPNGKVDRRSLPAPDAVDAAPDPDAVGPRSPLEAQLLDLWQNILGRPVHGVHDNFFALGGHSLMATQVMARVRSQFDVKISLRTLFEAPTVAGLAEAIVEQELAQADPLLLAELLGNL